MAFPDILRADFLHHLFPFHLLYSSFAKPSDIICDFNSHSRCFDASDVYHTYGLLRKVSAKLQEWIAIRYLPSPDILRTDSDRNDNRSRRFGCCYDICRIYSDLYFGLYWLVSRQSKSKTETKERTVYRAIQKRHYG